MECLVCGLSQEGERVCRMCGMKFSKGFVFSNADFCSAECVSFFVSLTEKSPEIAKREIIF